MNGRMEDRLFVPGRLAGYGAALLAMYVVIFAGGIWGRSWLFDANGALAFLDFVWIWLAATFALVGDATTVYDHVAFAAAQVPYVELSRKGFPYYHFVYPPTLLLFIAPLGLLPYVAAFTIWMLSTALLYLYAIYRIVPRAVVFLLALLPLPFAQNLFLGQTGFLLAGLLGLALGLMARRPYLAGMCLGLLTYKPQFGLIFPIVLLVTWQWRVIVGAAVTVAMLFFAVSAFYGMAAWDGYLRTLRGTNVGTFMSDENLNAIIQTAFGVMHWAGASLGTKWTVYVVVSLLTTTLVCVICRRPVSDSLKAAALGIGALTVTPYMLAYDLTALAVPVAFLTQEGLASGFLPGERFTLVGCFLAVFLMPLMPVGPLILAILMILLLRRVFRQESERSTV